MQRMTDFQRCFWAKKARHMDLIFFVRVGAFYELYDVRPEPCTSASNPVHGVRG